jgi:hypothetical protein
MVLSKKFLSNFNLNYFYKVVFFLVLINQKMARKKHYKINILINENFIPIKLTRLLIFREWI